MTSKSFAHNRQSFIHLKLHFVYAECNIFVEKDHKVLSNIVFGYVIVINNTTSPDTSLYLLIYNISTYLLFIGWYAFGPDYDDFIAISCPPLTTVKGHFHFLFILTELKWINFIPAIM